MVLLSNNDRFDNDKIFLRNIWHFSVMMTTRKIMPYSTILITGLSLVRKINILLCKTGKCIYFMPDTLFLLLFRFIFFFSERKINTTSDAEVDDDTYDVSFDESDFDE